MVTAGNKATRKLIGQILVELGSVTEAQVREALDIKHRKGGATGAVLVELGYCTERDISLALAVQSGMQQINLDELEIPPELLEKVDPMTARSYRIIPVSLSGGRLTVAMGDPENFRTLDDLHFLLGLDLEGAVADPAAIQRALDKYYKDEAASMEEVMGELESLQAQFFSPEDDASGSKGVDLADVSAMADSQPVKKLLNLVLLQAIRDKASDIHFEPFEDEFKMRYRIDGVLYEMVPPPRHIALAVASRIKVMSNLDIAERRLPQDGRIELNVGGNSVDLRVSVLPTMFGESVVMRVLDRTQISLDLAKVGLRDDELKEFRDILELPNGIVVVTGPTGSGKTTTLYSALRELNKVDVKVITTEDPVEYDIDGLVQVQINEDIGLTFASCLRSILRQDPDIILVGEMRDFETVETAIHASLTGHLVFSTLHTNDAPTAVTRLLDMGVEPYLLTSTVEAIVGQRLVRRICLHCRSEFKPTEDMLMELNLTPETVKNRTFYYGRGCEHCNNTGYRGRTAIFEIMRMDDELRDLIRNHASSNVLRSAARQRGMRSLRESGLLSIYDGVTTIEEVVKETIWEE